MPKIKNLSDLKPDPNNPRIISEEALNGLSNSIDSFGDISGITVNADGTLISGHQRVTALIEKYGDLEIKENKIILPNGNTFQIRRVKWDNNKAIAANISANNQFIAGTFTPELSLILEDIEINSPELFLELNLIPLKLDIDTNPPTNEEKDSGGEGSNEEWVKFAVGSKVGVVHKDVYLLFCSEWDRLSGIVESEEITPIMECMIANSAGTPGESLE